MHSTVSEQPASPWTSVFARLGLTRTKERQWRGACPACGYRNTFCVTLNNNDQSLHYFAACGCDEASLTASIREVMGGNAMPPARPTIVDPVDAAKNRERALRMWNSAQEIAGTPAGVYLTRRRVPHLIPSQGLAFHPALRDLDSGTPRPVLIGAVLDAEGSFLAVHRTYLSADGLGKAAITTQRATLGAKRGGAIRLDPTASEIVVAEGIETAGSAGIRFSLPAWAAIDAGNLRVLELPPQVGAVLIAVDPDPPGEAAARRAAERWSAEGRKVRLVRPSVPGKDFNDILMAEAGQ